MQWVSTFYNESHHPVPLEMQWVLMLFRVFKYFYIHTLSERCNGLVHLVHELLAHSYMTCNGLDVVV